MSDEHARLRDISTRWSCIKDVNRFVLRYTSAMSSLLELTLKDKDISKDVLQSFLVKVIERGFHEDITDNGRFRDYLGRSLRNAAIDHFRGKQPSQASDEMLNTLQSRWDSHDDSWKQAWTRCLLDRAWQQLEHQQYSSPGSLYYTVLRFSVDHPDSRSESAAEILSSETGREISASSFRQQLKRARERFARHLVDEIRETLEEPTEDAIEQEIAALGLQTYITRYVNRESFLP